MGASHPWLAKQALADEITTLYAHINAATFRLLQLIASFDEQGLYSHFGAQTTAHWLNWACGIGMGTAREKVRVARALEALPQISSAFQAGGLSFSKARALTRVATPDSEATLLELARSSTAAQTERIMSHYRQALLQDDANHSFITEESRSFEAHWDQYGNLSFRGHLSPDQGAVFLKALDKVLLGMGLSFEQQLNRQRSFEEQLYDPYPVAAQRADALMRMAEQALDEPTSEASVDKSSSTADRFQVSVHVSAETLAAEGMLDLDDPPEIEAGPVIGRERARRLCCDGSVVPIVENAEGEVLNVGRKTRTVPPAIRRALKKRDKGCRFPGCHHTYSVDAHHIQHWADGGETRLDNLVLLCRHHHGLLHEGGYTIEREITSDTEGVCSRYVFTSPSGYAWKNNADDLTDGCCQTLMKDVSAETSAHGLPPITASTCISTWDGRQPDYSHILWCMVNFMRR